MTIEAIHPPSFPWFRYEGYSFSLGLTDGTTAWLSGHSASTYDAGAKRIVVRGPMAEQATTAYAKILTILHAADFGVEDVVHVVENVTVGGLGDREVASEVLGAWLGHRPVPVTTRVIDHLLRPDALIEVEVTARRGGAEQLAGGVWEAGGTVHLPMVIPLDDDGRVVAAGDPAVQYRYCLEQALALLSAAGLRPVNVVRIVDHVTGSGPGPVATASIQRDLLGPVRPAGGAVTAAALHDAGVTVALEVTASTLPGRAVDPGWAQFERRGSSPAVVAGESVFVSMLTGADPATGLVGDLDVVAQAEAAYEQLGNVLGKLGLGTEDLIETVEFVVPGGLPAYRGVAGVRQRRLHDPWPASTGIVCAGLPDGALFAVLPTALGRTER